jgi:hypothetical protein
MTTRLDLALEKYPNHEEGVRLLAERDPSGNMKYLDWSAKMLASGQALASEIADVVDLFHKFSRRPVPFGHRVRRTPQHIRQDIYSYAPHELALLRDNLLKVKRAQDRKRKKREKLYAIEGAVEAEVVYESDELLVRHIKNKNASVHYGLGTKWCIAMKREGYFEDYESQNATFFFFERKSKKGDEYDKTAVMFSRDGAYSDVQVFTALDERVGVTVLARAYGSCAFDILRVVYEKSEAYPGSTLACVYAGKATGDQLRAAFEAAKERSIQPYERWSILEAICCNEAAPWSLLEEIRRRARALLAPRKSSRHRRWRFRMENSLREIECALVIHVSTPDDVRQKIARGLRRRHVRIEDIHVATHGGRVELRAFRRPRNHRRYRRHPTSVSQLEQRLVVFRNMLKRAKKRLAIARRKKRLAEKKRLAKKKLG